LLLSALFAVAGIWLGILGVHAATGTNEQINYQGRLLTNTGAVVPDGTYNIEFKIYQDGDGVLGGGDETLKWTETRTGANKVTVKNGYFSVYLGSVTAFGGNVNWNQDTLWLSVNIGGTGAPTYDGEMSPFTRLSSSPYALNSGRLGGLNSSQFVQLAQGLQVDSSTSNASIAVNKTGGTANILDLQRAGSSVLLINNSGYATFKPASGSDGTSAFQIQNAAGSSLFNVDTANRINTNNADLSVGLAANTGSAGRLFSDGFESNGFSLWTTNTSIVTDTATVRNGKYSAKMAMTGTGKFAEVRLGTSAGVATAYARSYVNFTSQTNDFTTLALQDTSNNIFSAWRQQSTGFLCIFNPFAVGSTCSTTVLPSGQWHKLELRFTKGTPGTIELYYDDAQIINVSQNTGNVNINRFDLGDNVSSRTATMYYDDVSVDTVATGPASSVGINDSLHIGGTTTFGNSVLLQGASDSGSSFQILNASGNSLLNVDTSSMALSLNGVTSISGALTLSSGGQAINFTGATSNYINFNTNGVAAPAFTTRSNGAKIVLFNSLNGTNVDYGFGIEASTLWSSVATTASQFKWYGGTTQAALLTGTGSLTTAAGITATTGDLTLTAGNLLTGATQRLSNAGALSNITGYAQSSGSFLQSGSGSFGTGTGAVALNSNTTINPTAAVGNAALTIAETNGDGIIRIQGGGGNQGFIRYSNINQALSISNGTYNADQFVFDAGGSFGIGVNGFSYTKLSVSGVGAVNGITLGAGTAQPANLYRGGNDLLQTDDSFTAGGLLTGSAGATILGATTTINTNSNFNTSINTGTSTGTVAIGSSSNTGNFTLESGTTATNLFNGATAHIIAMATSNSAAQTLTIGGTGLTSGSNSGSTVAIQGGATALSIANAGVTLRTFTDSSTAFQMQNASGTAVLNLDTVYRNLSVGVNLSPMLVGVQSTKSTATTKITDSDNVGFYSSIAIGTDGLPVISHQNTTTGDLAVTKCTNAACSASTTTKITDADNVGAYSSIAIGTDGLPIISHQNATTNDLAVTKCTNAACSASTTTKITDADSVGFYSSIAIGTDGLPVISYLDNTTNDLVVTKCTNASCSTNSSTKITDANITGFYSSIAIGTDGLPVIVHRDSTLTDLAVTKCTNASCSTNSTTKITDADDVGYYASIAIGTDGLPMISHYNNTTGDLAVTKCTNASCSTNSTTKITDADDIGWYTSVAIGTDGLPVISEQDNSTGDLAVTKCTNASCSTNSTTKLTDSDITGLYSSIAIGTDGLPVISHRDGTTTDLAVTLFAGSTGSSTVNSGGISLGSPNTSFQQAYIQGINTSDATNPFTLGTNSITRLSIDGAGTSTFSGAVVARNAVDSTTAFQIQNAAGTSNLLVADTTNTKLGVGTAPSAGGATLQVTGTLSTTSTINGATISGGTLSGGSVSGSTLTGSGLTFTALSATTIQSASGTTLNIVAGGNLNLSGGSAGNISIDPADGNLSLATSANPNLVTIGNTANSVVQTKAFNTIQTINGSGVAIKTGTNSLTGFQIQNATAEPIFLVDTTSTMTNGNTLNYLSYPGFESGAFNNAAAGWNSVSPGTLSQNTSRQHTYNGITSAQLVTTTSNGGITTGSFTSAPPTATVYIVSFYAKVSSGTMASTSFLVTSIDGTTHTCSPAAGITINSTGFQRLFCQLPTTTGAMTALSIAQQTDNVVRTIYIDGVQLQSNQFNGATITAPTVYQIGSIQLRGVITNPVTLMNSGDSTSAFQIQNAAGTSNLFVADTLNNRIGIGTATPLVDLDVGGNTTSAGVIFNVSNSGNSASGQVLAAVYGSATAGTSFGLSNNNLAQLRVSSTANAVIGNSANGSLSIGTNNLVQATISNIGATTFKNSTNGPAAFQVQNQNGDALLLVNSTTAAPVISLGSSGALALASTTNISTSTGATQAVNIGSAGAGTAAAGTTVNIQGGTTANTAVTIGTNGVGGITIDSGSTGAINIGTGAAAKTITVGSTNTTSKLTLQGGAITTTNNQGGVLIASGFSTSDTTLTPLTLDSTTTFTETASTCTTSVNGGALYYNSAQSSGTQGGSTAIRACINGSWEDLVSTAALGIMLYGVVPDSGSNPGDLISAVTPGVTGPCKVSWATASTLTVAPCTAYSGGRKIIVASTTLTTTTGAINDFAHVCLTGTNGAPALSARGTETANLPAFSIGNPILCLADIDFAATTNVISHVYDMRAFTTSTKEFAITAAALPVGAIACPSGKQVTTCGAATGNAASGVVVAFNSAATTSTTTPNAILAVAGPTMAKPILTTVTAGTLVGTSATTNRATSTAALTAPTVNLYSNMGISRSASPATACTTTASAANCDYQLYFFQTRR
jgi:hypothetical protein